MDGQAVTGLVLSGGGARAAYQVGVLKAIAELKQGSLNPFPVIAGTSAGAINAAALASGAQHFTQAVERLTHIWQRLECSDIYRTDWPGVLRQAARFTLRNLLGMGQPTPVALLNNTPLAGLLNQQLDTRGIIGALRSGALKAAAVTAFDYSSGQNVTFYQSKASRDWQRYRRQGVACRLSAAHLLASSAIPLVFAPVEIEARFYGDGALRQLAPISPALRLGASQILMIGVSHAAEQKPVTKAQSPTLAHISGQLLNSAFIDNLEADIEVLERLNSLAAQAQGALPDIEPIKVLVINPSQPLDRIAAKHHHELPRSIGTFLRGSGAMDSASGAVLSYLLFAPGYCGELIELGYQDGLAKAAQIQAFFAG